MGRSREVTALPTADSEGAGRPPTLLVFTLGADQDAQRRPLLPAALLAAERDLREACLASALEAGRAAGCRLVVVSPKPLAPGAGIDWMPQEGATFADRLRGALARAFAEGSGPVLMVGGDSPGLEAAHLRRALEILSGTPDAVVLGPAADGGVYLLGANQPFDSALAAVRWCDRRTRASLVASLNAHGRPALVLELSLLDLDTRADLERWIAAGPGTPLLRALSLRLSRLLASSRRPGAAASCRAARSHGSRLHSGRAPPPPAR
jgi:2-phospho-L-lactate guanylyltransferase (CobY/MobA/RfbA family)